MVTLPPGGPFLLFDFDSTLVTVEALDELFVGTLSGAGPAGPADADPEVAIARFRRLTDAGMDGALPHHESLSARLALFPGGGPTRAQVERTAAEVAGALSPSVVRNLAFFRRYQARIRIVSGGFVELIGPAAQRLAVAPHRVTAHAFHPAGPAAPLGLDPTTPMARAGKVGAVRRLLDSGAIPRHRPLWIIGDGATDLELRTARLAHAFVAFTENVTRDPIVKAADHVVASMEELMALLANPDTPSRTFHD
jgi:D-3-phosphoglycerate dehydrogenase / 2-oxoglutarate reductase